MSNMSKEIDIRSLIMDKLTSEYLVKDCSTFVKSKETNNSLFGDQLIFRNFNKEMWWSKSRQTAFIESIYMGCELPLIVVFELSSNPVKYLVIDGLNRILTIQNFLNDDLKLLPNSIKKAKFLENKTFTGLNKDERDYFSGRSIQVLKYSYNDKSKNLTEEEIEEIAKQIYLRYNSGIKLKNEEIQKADYEDDEVTKKIYDRIKDKDFLNKLKSIYFTPQKVTKTFKESTLMYCRLAITSCYAPLRSVCNQKSILNKIDLFYRDYTMEVNKDSIFDDFIDTVLCLYELTKQDYWKNAPKLHNQNFMMTTYWMLFNIKKHNLINLKDFNWHRYIYYFGTQEEIQPLFSNYYVNAENRYNAVINYMNDYYKIDLKDYIVKESNSLRTNKVDTFAKLPKYNFQLARDGITINSLLQQLKKDSYVLRPSYQRMEINNIESSSFLIESVILNMAIPDILVYRHEDDKNRTIFEVVDGQQRCFTLLGFLKQRYTNYLKEEVSSEKDGFSLSGLTICQDLNNKKVDSHKKAFKLDERYIEKINNGKIRIVYIPEKDNPYFSVKDYFTSINKTIIPLKKTSYRYWNVCCDSKLMKMAEEIAKNFQGKILPKIDYKYLPQQYVVNLAYLFYHNSSLENSFSVQQVSSWLNDFNVQKYKLINELKDDEVEIIRNKYKKSFEKVEEFLTRIQNWLNTEGKTISDVVAKKIKRNSFTDLLCLYYLLNDINQGDLFANSTNIYNVVFECFTEIAKNNLTLNEKKDIVGKYKNRLSFSSPRTIETLQIKEESNFDKQLSYSTEINAH